MELSPFGVRVTSGTLREAEGTLLEHAWTEEGAMASPATNGAQLLHLAVAFCVLNDTYREARPLGIQVDGVAVEADGGFDTEGRSTGIRYSLEVSTEASPADVDHLREVVAGVAEIPKTLRAGVEVTPVR